MFFNSSIYILFKKYAKHELWLFIGVVKFKQ